MSTGPGRTTRLRHLGLGPHRASAYFVITVLTLSVAGVWYLWPQKPETRIVCVAAADLPAYDQITRADIHLAAVQSDQVPTDATADPASLVERYTLAGEQRDQPFDPGDLGPRLASGALTAQVIVGLPMLRSDIDGGAIERGDRIDLLLSSTAAQNPRSEILPGATVLDVKSDGRRTRQVVVVCAFAQRYENTLLAAGGTARIFVALVPSLSSR